jgi:conjugal transfer pilus assembly protein TraB
MAGTLSGLGHALTPQQALSINLNPSSSGLNTIPVKQAFEQAAGEGVGNAMSKVADHYLKQADKLYPIIEIEAGREIEIVVLKGQQLKLENKPSSAVKTSANRRN